MRQEDLQEEDIKDYFQNGCDVLRSVIKIQRVIRPNIKIRHATNDQE